MKLFKDKFVLIILLVILGIVLLYYVPFFKITEKKYSSIIDNWETTSTIIFTPISLILTFITTIIAWKIYQNFDVKKQYINKQLDTVTALSAEITKTKVRIAFYRAIPNPNTEINHSLEIYELDFFALGVLPNEKFENVFIKARTINQLLPFINYKSNPILPKSIAKSLTALHKYIEYSFSTKKEELMTKSYILLSPLKFTSEDNIVFIYEYMKCSELNQKVFELRNEIVNWLKKYGAEDINL